MAHDLQSWNDSISVHMKLTYPAPQSQYPAPQSQYLCRAQCQDTMAKLQANIRKEQLLSSKLGVDFYVHVRSGPCI